MIVAVVVAVTLVVVTVNPRAVVPDATVTLAGTLDDGRVAAREETTRRRPAAAPDSVTKADVGEPPATLAGLAVTLCSVTVDAPAGVDRERGRSAQPLYVAVITTSSRP